MKKIIMILVAAIVMMLSCGGDAGMNSETGSLRAPCYPNNTCDDGLICMSDICVELSDSDGEVSDGMDDTTDEVSDEATDEVVDSDETVDDEVVDGVTDSDETVDEVADEVTDEVVDEVTEEVSDEDITEETGKPEGDVVCERVLKKVSGVIGESMVCPVWYGWGRFVEVEAYILYSGSSPTFYVELESVIEDDMVVDVYNTDPPIMDWCRVVAGEDSCLIRSAVPYTGDNILTSPQWVTILGVKYTPAEL